MAQREEYASCFLVSLADSRTCVALVQSVHRAAALLTSCAVYN